jgi:hypothetical protein
LCTKTAEGIEVPGWAHTEPTGRKVVAGGRRTATEEKVAPHEGFFFKRVRNFM